MSEENISQVDDKCCLDDANPMEIPLVIDEQVQGDDVLLPAAETNHHVNLIRYSTGALDKPAGKPQVQTRYRGSGNQMSSTHDLCKHGKRREEDLVIKPWKLVKKKNVASGDLVKGETFRKSLGNVSKPDKSPLRVVKKEAACEVAKSCDGLRVKKSETNSTTSPSASAVVRMVKKTTNLDVKKVSKISENKSSKVDLSKNLKNKEKTEIDDSLKQCDDSMEKTNVDVNKVSMISEVKSSKEDLLKNLKNKEKIDEPVGCDDVMKKTNPDVKKVSRISVIKNSKEDLLKNLKNKEKMKIDEPVRSDDALEKTLYVVESSIEKRKKKSITSVKSETQQSSEKKFLRSSGEKSLSLSPSLSPSSEEVKKSPVTRSDPRPIRQTTSRSKTGLSVKKETGSANLATNPKNESKIIRPTRIGLIKVTPPAATKQLTSFKKGKVLEPKTEDSTATSIKFKKRVVQEPKLRSDVNRKKKNLKDKREGIGKINGEGKREKVVLRHRKVEVKKKLQTLFNNVIEETVNKLEEVRKSKVKALVGAFETVISLQDNNRTSQKKKTQSKPTSSSQAVEGF
ncbi:PREDICTED: B3 domain-containing protein Os02g0598200-like [Camelina sativa]|uniref:B3 domain-containing protein Os02g0598200-like n=1 Tax=Camelina sativa TaxID=90675 RepID=A0ABM0V914_CAMSA|nr:PREDICTED: B3 domain-containing protein Os02g0598200-like [Camelina sativa]